MKIGIITYWDSPNNYGQVLQGFATEYLLRKLGNTPFIIRFGREDNLCTNIDPWRKKIMRVLKGERTILQIIKRRLAQKQEDVNRGFDDFRNQYMSYTSDYYPNFESLKKKCPEADCFVTGSDQVWASFGAMDTHRCFLLDFLPDWKPRFSLSSSFCRTSMIEEHKKLFKHCLSKYLAISVREVSGLKLCESIGVKAEHIIDPTLLLSKSEWQKALPFDNQKNEGRRRVFFYVVTLDKTQPYLYKLMHQFEERGYEVIYCHSYNFLDGKRNCDPTILEWLSYINTSDLIVTNSFHGFAFSVNFNTPFIALSKSKKIDINGQDSRMYSVLSGMGLENRLMAVSDVNYILDHAFEEIDWQKANNYFEKQREKATVYLDDVLNLAYQMISKHAKMEIN